MDGKCRWVNITVPGFDQEDERRGTYSGSAEQFAEMIVRIIKKLNLGKVIYCGHSLGSIYAAYFI
jgi:pimeloyl-ACP methyl ester carboxylesterase